MHRLVSVVRSRPRVYRLRLFTERSAVFRSDTSLVVLHASVLDKTGKLVTNLPQTAFKVFENGSEQQIKQFKREDVPVSMGVLIDDSGSMRDKRAKVSAAALGS